MRRRACRSLLLQFLFLISSDLMLFSRAGRNDSDEFFAIMILPVHINNQQYYAKTAFDLVACQRYSFLFSSMRSAATRQRSSSNTSTANSKEIPSCFLWFRSFFA